MSSSSLRVGSICAAKQATAERINPSLLLWLGNCKVTSFSVFIFIM